MRFLVERETESDKKTQGACSEKRDDVARSHAPRKLSLTLAHPQNTGTLKPWSALPGPRALPFLGNALEFASMPKGRPQIHRLWQRLANEHGPLYRVSLPFKKFVVVADPRLVPGILGRKGLPKTGMYRVTLDVFSFMGRHDNMFTVMGTHDPKWLTARKGFAATVSEESVRNRFGLVAAATDKLCGALEARVVSADGEAKTVTPIEMQDASLRLALDVILGAAFEAEGGALQTIGDRRKSEGGDGASPCSSSSAAAAAAPLPPSYSFAPCPLLDSLHECCEYIYGSLEKPWLLPLFKVAPFLPAARRHRRQHERLYNHWAELVAHVRGRKGTVEQLEQGKAPKYDGSYGSCLVREEREKEERERERLRVSNKREEISLFSFPPSSSSSLFRNIKNSPKTGPPRRPGDGQAPDGRADPEPGQRDRRRGNGHDRTCAVVRSSLRRDDAGRPGQSRRGAPVPRAARGGVL